MSNTLENPAGKWSITVRLTLLYALSAFTILMASTFFMYWALTSSLARSNQQFLFGEVAVLRGILREYPINIPALQQEVAREAIELNYAKHRYFCRVLDAQGNIVLETPGMSRVIDVSKFPPAPRGPTYISEIIPWHAYDDRSFLLMSAWINHNQTSQHLIQVALDVRPEQQIIAEYRRNLVLVLLLGILFSATVSAMVARRGLRPLRDITAKTKRITIDQLHERLDSTSWPKELTALASALNKMLDRIESSVNHLAQFSADLAHEFRTPINNLMGEAEIALSRSRTTDEYRQVLASSLEEYAKLARMIDSLLFLARTENTQMGIAKVELDARKTMDAVCEFHQIIAEEKNIQLTCEGQAKLLADPILLRRALSNLVSNALKYTPSGGTITLNVKENREKNITISVTDTGVGIGAEHLPYIFERFYRVDQARSHDSGGTGLGLSIVKSIMDLHKGSVNIQSQPGTGTTVTLTFPD